MDEGEALRAIQGYVATGRIRYTRHAEERMIQRGVRHGDVRAAITTATRAGSQDGGTWKVTGGTDCDGEALAVVVALDGGVVVVTVF